MKRREIIKLMPLSLAGMTGAARYAFGREMSGVARPVETTDRLGLVYLETVRNRLDWIRENQSENLLEAAYAIARAHQKGNTCWYSWDMGHTTTSDLTPGRNGLPEIFTLGFDGAKAKDGDAALVNIGGGNDAMLKKNMVVIGSPVPWSMDAEGDEEIVLDSAKTKIRPYCDIWIETKMTKLGAILKIPGMPAPTGPISGIIGMVTFWMIVADICRILARDGKSVAVSGDEPELGKNAPYVSLDAPLMDDWYLAFARQHEMIAAEYGNIKKVADMAVDAVLAGGRVQCYARYAQSLPAEAKNRRGGLALTEGVYVKDGVLTGQEAEFVPSKNDLVIMGFASPDDPVDLVSLDTFRKYGMKVVSIGPMTRDIKVPAGRTIPKEADLHIGRMCDTYGLFAVPGFARKVCPTSGAMMNQIFWATCMEMIDAFNRRTGNIPAIFFTGAVKGGIDHMIRMQTIHGERGY